MERQHHAGGPIDDLCRQCKVVRRHTVIATDAQGHALRVVCDHCGSQHNFRGGDPERPEPRPERVARPAAPPMPRLAHAEQERTMPAMSVDDAGDLERLLRRVVREECGLTPLAPAARWRGGQLVLRPASGALQEKAWPIDTFFSKIVMVRNRLRTLEQQVNASELPADEKLKLQGYVTACYGSLTSFNVLFAEDEDKFKGAGGE